MQLLLIREIYRCEKIFLHGGAIPPRYMRTGSNLCIVPPGKKQLYPILKHVWEKATSRLMQADELIIIGCSLNPSDANLMDLIKAFINIRGIENIKLIYKGDRQMYRDRFNIADDQLYNYGFHLHNPNPNNIGAIEFIFQ